jgi:hypothetical protein
MKKKDLFSITDHFEGKVKRLTLTIQDAPIYKSPEEKDTLVGNSATIFGTLQLYKPGDKKKVDGVNFTLPLTHNEFLKTHILGIISEAISLHENK